jgi:hypothetical protein
VATGPLLPAITGEMAKNCQNYWWTNILYINNYVRVDHMVSNIFITFVSLVSVSKYYITRNFVII